MQDFLTVNLGEQDILIDFFFAIRKTITFLFLFVLVLHIRLILKMGSAQKRKNGVATHESVSIPFKKIQTKVQKVLFYLL